MVPEKNGCDALSDKGVEFDSNALLNSLTLTEFSGFEYGLNCGEEAVCVLAHDGVETLALLLIAGMTLEGVEIETDAGDRSFEFVCDGVEKGILALVAADFTQEKDGVYNHACDEDGEEQYTEKVKRKAAAIVVNPCDVQDDREDDKAHAERDKERFSSATSCEVHR